MAILKFKDKNGNNLSFNTGSKPLSKNTYDAILESIANGYRNTDGSVDTEAAGFKDAFSALKSLFDDNRKTKTLSQQNNIQLNNKPYTYSPDEYINWIKNSPEYKNANGSPLGDINSQEAKDYYRPKYANLLKQIYGDDAYNTFIKNKPLPAVIQALNSNAGGANIPPAPFTKHNGVANVPTLFTVAQNKANKKRIGTTLQQGVAKTADDIIAEEAEKKRIKSELTQAKTDDALLKAEKGSTNAALVNDLARAGTGIGQTIAGLVMNRKLKSQKPKEPKAPLTTAFDTRLAQAATDSQMADPVIRQKLISDLVQQKRYADEVARAASGGDITAYAGQAQANSGGVNTALRDVAAAETQDKLQRQAIYDQLLGRKMSNDMSLYNTNMQKYLGVDIPDFQARRAYTQNLTNTGLGNIFANATSAMESVKPKMLQNAASNDPAVKRSFVNMVTNNQQPYLPYDNKEAMIQWLMKNKSYGSGW